MGQVQSDEHVAYGGGISSNLSNSNHGPNTDNQDQQQQRPNIHRSASYVFGRRSRSNSSTNVVSNSTSGTRSTITRINSLGSSNNDVIFGQATSQYENTNNTNRITYPPLSSSALNPTNTANDRQIENNNLIRATESQYTSSSTASSSQYPSSPRIRRHRSIRCVLTDTNLPVGSGIESENQQQPSTIPQLRNSADGQMNTALHPTNYLDDNNNTIGNVTNNRTTIVVSHEGNNSRGEISFSSFISEDDTALDDENRLYVDPDDVYDNDEEYYDPEPEVLSGNDNRHGKNNPNRDPGYHRNNDDNVDEQDEDAMITYYYQRQRELLQQQKQQPSENDDAANMNSEHPPNTASRPLTFSRQGSLRLRKCDESTDAQSFISAEEDPFDVDGFHISNMMNTIPKGYENDADDDYCMDFYPIVSMNYEWMGRSVESLVLGHTSRAPILQLIDDDLMLGAGDMTDGYLLDLEFSRRRSTASTFAGSRRRSTASTFNGSVGRRTSLSLSTSMQGGTLANYYNASVGQPRPRHGARFVNEVDRSNSFNGSTPTTGASGVDYHYHSSRRGSMVGSNVPMGRRRSSVASTATPNIADDNTRNYRPASQGGPNVALKVLARELTGKTCFPRGIPETQRLYRMGGAGLLNVLDKPVAGIASEVAFLAAAIDNGDWAETHSIISRLVSRLMSDPSNAIVTADGRRSVIDDPNLPPTAPKFYAGGGRLGLERDAFIMAGGIQVAIRVFREKSFVGQEMSHSYDARDLSPELVSTRLASCWNEVLSMLRELIYAIPTLVEDGTIADDGNFLPFLFTLLSQDSCFDGAVSLIEEILSFMVQGQNQALQTQPEANDGVSSISHVATVSTPSMFFLGNVSNLYKLWRGFNCRQLAQFCRILALLVFEPEDRHFLESPAVLKSLELLQLRRNRAARSGRDSTVDMNQAILLGDEVIIRRLVELVTIMNYSPPLRRFKPYHVLAQFPFIADTLVMLGLHELGSWEEAERQVQLSRMLLREDDDDANDQSNNVDSDILISELGAVADMLQSLSNTLQPYSRQAQNQIGHIIHVISAAQQAGVIVGRNQNQRRNRRQRNWSSAAQSAPGGLGSNTGSTNNVVNNVGFDGIGDQGIASVAGLLTDQILGNRWQQSLSGDNENESQSPIGISRRLVENIDDSTTSTAAGVRHLINTPYDAANSLQFNAMLLGPYQVEVLFVLCTLLGGRRKLDAQDLLKGMGIITVLDEMFQRLPWYKRPQSQQEGAPLEDDYQTAAVNNTTSLPEEPQGIHGPGCECTPESALCVQYLRMLHNFCDRDCDNYPGRRLLLSKTERQIIFHGTDIHPTQPVQPGLLSKIIASFIQESDESPYRFWLASCIESYLRGSSPEEQMFVAKSGLLQHLVEEISSDRLHCAGSLQTSFDLLGELGKGNVEVLCLLVDDFEEESFRKLMSVAAANLVDSNVFIRSLFLTLEHVSARDGILPLYMDATKSSIPVSNWSSPSGSAHHAYLTHSWWDTPTLSLFNIQNYYCNEITATTDDVSNDNDNYVDERRPSDWFPPCEAIELAYPTTPKELCVFPRGLNESVGHNGWVFKPVGDGLAKGVFFPNTLDRMSWFLAANQARLLRDLLRVIDLGNINHENICCLNTAVVIAIFAHRRKQLALLLQELRLMNDEERMEIKKRRVLLATDTHHKQPQRQQHRDDVVDRAFVQAMSYLDLDHENQTYARRASLGTSSSGANTVSAVGGLRNSSTSTSSGVLIGDRTDILRNFREVLWFWKEYYTHRGRDRLSLEFSSHIRFNEWNTVVTLLSADDDTPTSLVRSPVRLPCSPYQRSARVGDNPIRGE